MNHFFGIGRLTRSAELTFTKSNVAICKFSICISKKWKDEKGEWQEKVNFFNCVLWGKYGESMSKYLTKGKQIAIEAELEQNVWEKNGVKHNDYQLNVKELMLLQSPKGESREGLKDNNGKPYNDDVPF